MTRRIGGRRRFLRATAAIGLGGLSGCLRLSGSGGEPSGSTGGPSDSDGDGVIDSEDYAPRDPAVQERADLDETAGPETDASAETETDAERDRETSTTEGTSSDPLVEGFESGSLDEWRDVVTAATTTAKARTGDRSLVITDQNDDFGSNDIGNVITRSFEPISPSRLRASLSIDGGRYNTAKVVWLDDSGTAVHALAIRNYDDQLEYNRPTSLVSTEPSTWYATELVDVDWERDRIGAIRVNGEVRDTAVPFLNAARDVSEVRVFVHDGGTGSVGHFDDITVGPA